MVRFLLEIFRRTEYPPEKAIVAAVTIDNEGRKVSKITTETHPTTGYWIDWGGSYDNPESNKVVLFFGFFLSIADTIAAIISDGSSMYRGTDLIYFTTDFYAWQYPTFKTELSELEGFSSSVPDPNNPSDNILDGFKYPVRFGIPQLLIKIPDSISGSALQNATFTVAVDNHDGKFDLVESNNFFNVPVFILKSYEDNPAYSDFQVVRRGWVDNQQPSFEQFTLTVATTFRSLSEDVSKKIGLVEYPNVSNDNLGKVIPILYGTVSNIGPILVDTNTYIVADPDYLVSVDAVYDSDDVLISAANYSVVDGLLVMDGTTNDPDKITATGLSTNRIGEIITDEIQAKSNILYSNDVWDTTETDDYRTNSPKINILYSTGNIKAFVAEVLKSDNAFLIEKSDGKLTLRKWGNSYGEHTLKAENITQKPTMKHVNSKFFASTAVVKYSGGEIVDDASENSIVEIYRKSQTRTYDTKLAAKVDAESLGAAMVERYGKRAQEWTIPFGINLAGVSLLDTIIIDLKINDRLLTNSNIFIVKSVDVSQDILMVESKGQFKITDGILATPSGVGYSGDASGFFNDDSDATAASIFTRVDI